MEHFEFKKFKFTTQVQQTSASRGPDLCIAVDLSTTWLSPKLSQAET